MYVRVLAPLSKLRKAGLEAFFPTLASPWNNTVSTCPWTGAKVREIQRIKSQILRFTRRMEQVIMGDEYDSSLLQHRAHGQSQWLKERMLLDGSF